MTEQTQKSILDSALAYAAKGWAVFPLQPGAKAPLTPHGFKDASTDHDQINRWWAEHPNANLGLCTGQASGVIVIDVDRHGSNDGEASLAKLEDEFGPLPATHQVRTPNDGRHIYFAHADQELRSRIAMRPGIDLKADGGYVVAPPSVLDGVPE